MESSFINNTLETLRVHILAREWLLWCCCGRALFSTSTHTDDNSYLRASRRFCSNSSSSMRHTYSWNRAPYPYPRGLLLCAAGRREREKRTRTVWMMTMACNQKLVHIDQFRVIKPMTSVTHRLLVVIIIQYYMLCGGLSNSRTVISG